MRLPTPPAIALPLLFAVRNWLARSATVTPSVPSTRVAFAQMQISAVFVVSLERGIRIVTFATIEGLATDLLAELP